MSRLLISFCNTLPQGFALAAYDFNSHELEWVDPPATPDRIGGAVGICSGDFGYLVLFQHRVAGAPSTLAMYEPDLRMRFATKLHRVSDAHSMILYGSGVLVVSTGTNEIIKLVVHDNGAVDEEPVWAVGNIREDVDHLNGIAVFRSRVCVSAFGPAPADAALPRSGVVLDIATGAPLWEGLLQPHSLVESGGNLYALESARGRVWRFTDASSGFTGELVAELPGYLRGLAFRDGYAFIGASAERRRSKSKGTLRPAPATTSAALHCMLHRLDLTSGAVESRDLTPFSREIYDIALLPPDCSRPRAGASQDAIIARQLAFDSEHLQALEDLRIIVERYR